MLANRITGSGQIAAHLILETVGDREDSIVAPNGYTLSWQPIDTPTFALDAQPSVRIRSVDEQSVGDRGERVYLKQDGEVRVEVAVEALGKPISWERGIVVTVQGVESRNDYPATPSDAGKKVHVAKIRVEPGANLITARLKDR